MLGSYEAAATIPAEDLARAMRFYTEVLGLKVLMSDEGSALLEAGKGSKVFMYQRERTKAEHTAITFNVNDLENVVEGLTAKGVVFEQYDLGEIKTDERGIAAAGENMIAWLTDPEGNILGLASM